MSVAAVLQALGWVSVAWLVTVHLLIQHGRLPEHGIAYRVAGCAAAVSVVSAGAAAQIWPVAVLGLLWLRIEVFGRRHHLPDCPPGPAAGHDHSPVPEQMPALLVGSLARGERSASAPHPPSKEHLVHHLPHPHLGKRTVDRVFKIEMGIVIIIAVTLFVIWAEQQRVAFTSNTDYVVCNWIDGC